MEKKYYNAKALKELKTRRILTPDNEHSFEIIELNGKILTIPEIVKIRLSSINESNIDSKFWGQCLIGNSEIIFVNGYYIDGRKQFAVINHGIRTLSKAKIEKAQTRREINFVGGWVSSTTYYSESDAHCGKNGHTSSYWEAPYKTFEYPFQDYGASKLSCFELNCLEEDRKNGKFISFAELERNENILPSEFSIIFDKTEMWDEQKLAAGAMGGPKKLLEYEEKWNAFAQGKGYRRIKCEIDPHPSSGFDLTATLLCLGSSDYSVAVSKMNVNNINESLPCLQ